MLTIAYSDPSIKCLESGDFKVYPRDVFWSERLMLAHIKQFQWPNTRSLKFLPNL